jgi:hypothetical protein
MVTALVEAVRFRTKFPIAYIEILMSTGRVESVNNDRLGRAILPHLSTRQVEKRSAVANHHTEMIA